MSIKRRTSTRLSSSPPHPIDSSENPIKKLRTTRATTATATREKRATEEETTQPSKRIQLEDIRTKAKEKKEQAKALAKEKKEQAKALAKKEKEQAKVLAKAEKERIKAEKEKIKAEKEKKRKKNSTLPPEANVYWSADMKGRVLRAMKQKMFVLSRELVSNDDSSESFEVLGSIGNNYTVTISSTIKCTCMDYSIRRKHCKHILMVLLKVYRLPCDSPLFKSLSTDSAERLHARRFCQQVDPSVLVPPEARERIMKLMYGEAQTLSDTGEAERRPLDTSDCPVCFEEFEQENINDIDYCKICGNNIHKGCFTMWASSKGSNVTCVYCRSKWVQAQASGSAKFNGRHLDRAHNIERGFANFAQELGIDTERDTSTYKNHRGYAFDNH